MARARLSLARMLEEEYAFLYGRIEKRTWAFDVADLYEPAILYDRLRAADPNRRHDRYCVLRGELEGAGISWESRPADFEQKVIDRLNRSTLTNDALLRNILSDPRAQERILRATHLMKLLFVSAADRALLFENPTILERLLHDPEQFSDFLDDSETLQTLLEAETVLGAVRQRPALLNSLIESRELREALAGSWKFRLLLPAMFDPWSKYHWHLPAKLEKELSVTDLSTLASDPNAILRALREEKIDSVKVAIDAAAAARSIDAIRHRNTVLIETVFTEHFGERRELRAMFDQFHDRAPSAICLSGGGIRSATFNLGVLQGLARVGALPRFTYLSTVSGGGYIGAWLSSWMRRHENGAEGALEELKHGSNNPLLPEPPPVRHLREYSNYLAPRSGFFSIDSWTLIATYLRNLLLHWTMMVPLIVFALALPRLYEALAMRAASFESTVVAGAFAITGLLLSSIAIARYRPAGQHIVGPAPDIEKLRRERAEVVFWTLPLLIAAAALPLQWAWFSRAPCVPEAEALWLDGAADLVYVYATVLLAAINFLAGLVFMHQFISERDPLATGTWRERARRFLRNAISADSRRRMAFELAGGMTAAWTGGYLAALAVRLLGLPAASAPPNGIVPTEVFVWLALPIVLLIFFIEAAILAAITTPLTPEHDREWWARTGAWILFIGAAWLVISFCALIGPILILRLPTIMASLGGAAGLLTLVLGRSAKTPANQKEKEKAQSAAARTGGLLAAAATVFLLVLLSAISLLITKAMTPAEPMKKLTANQAIRVDAKIVAPARHAVTVQAGPKEEKPGIFTITEEGNQHLYVLRNTRALNVAKMMGLALLLCAIASIVLDVNTFSMHGMYRNRLIRAYLGASRWSRRPDPFTGFDPQDDLPMHELRPEMLWVTSIQNLRAFIAKLYGETDPKTGVGPQLDREMLERLESWRKSALPADDPFEGDMKQVLVSALNGKMSTWDLQNNHGAIPSYELLQKNREYLDSKYGRDYIRPLRRAKNGRRLDDTPLHIVNTTLNLVAGENLAWRHRKADSFTVSPLHSGNKRLGYRDSREYGGANGISLGTAVAISGAAVSPNMGYHSSPVVTFLMTLFNARLGWWLGNPSSAGQATYRNSSPPWSLGRLWAEAFGKTHDKSAYVFLSDGGHFENLGLYEMVLRRCANIIVCDATADSGYAYKDLANAVQKIRIDLGIPIEFDRFYIKPQDERDVGKYCAVGTIGYSNAKGETGRNVEDGNLVYIKPAVYRDAPADVRHYERQSGDFPHESTADQFFSETQFESYRVLGEHAILQIVEEATDGSPASLVEHAKLYIRAQPAFTPRSA